MQLPVIYNWHYSDGWFKATTSWAFNPQLVGWHCRAESSDQDFENWFYQHCTKPRPQYLTQMQGNNYVYNIHILDKNDAELFAEKFVLTMP